MGRLHLELDETPGTNWHALQLLAAGRPPEGTLVSARAQTAGRGRMSRHWHSQPGENLTVSYILYPSFLPAREQFYLNMAAVLGLRRAAQTLLPQADVRIKWPNDLYAGGRKLAGILIETALSGQQMQYAVAGIGWNINETNFPPTLPNPVSLKQLTGKTYSLPAVLSVLSASLEAAYLQLRAGKQAELKAAFMDALYHYPGAFRFRSNGKEWEGQIEDVTPEGRLVVSGKSYGFGEIEFL